MIYLQYEQFTLEVNETGHIRITDNINHKSIIINLQALETITEYCKNVILGDTSK